MVPQRSGHDTHEPESFSWCRTLHPSKGCPFSIPPVGRFCPYLIGSKEQADGYDGQTLPVRTLPRPSAHLQQLRPWPVVLFRSLFAIGPTYRDSGGWPALPDGPQRASQSCKTDAPVPRQKRKSDASWFTSSLRECSTDIGLGGERDSGTSGWQSIDHSGMALSFLPICLLGVCANSLSVWPPRPNAPPTRCIAARRRWWPFPLKSRHRYCACTMLRSGVAVRSPINFRFITKRWNGCWRRRACLQTVWCGGRRIWTAICRLFCTRWRNFHTSRPAGCTAWCVNGAIKVVRIISVILLPGTARVRWLRLTC